MSGIAFIGLQPHEQPKPIISRKEYLRRNRRRSRTEWVLRFLMAGAVILLIVAVGILGTCFAIAGLAALFG
ncbi:MAG: hypothetical protein OXK72_01685 [Gammaproteobacteria bacterium]|nr:hypothetical protein [Gammaproteobacteria bacterium]